MADVRARKYKPIYEAIEAHNYRGAMKLCAKRDIESAPLTKVLKAYCLVKLGGEAEALELCDDVMRTTPTDEDVCSTLSSVLHLCGESRRAAKVFEAAVAHNPTSVPLQRDLFFSYVLLGEHKQQQLTAMKLWKESNLPEFVFWAAIAMNNQVPSSVPAPNQTLNLAEMMMRRPLDAGTIRHGEALSLLFHTMVRQGKATDALALFRGPLHYVTSAEEEAKIAAADAVEAKTPDEEDQRNLNKTPALLQPGDALRLEIYLAIQTRAWEEVRELCGRGVTDIDPEDWSFYSGLLSALFLSGAAVDDAALTPSDVAAVVTSPYPTVTAVRSLLRKLQASQLSTRPPAVVRGPSLAEIVLDMALLQSRCGTGVAGEDVGTAALCADVTQRLLEYISRVGVSTSAFFDLQRVLTPFILPSSWTEAGAVVGYEANLRTHADADAVPLLSSFGLAYPAVDVFYAPLPQHALTLGFRFRMAEQYRAQLLAGVASLADDANRPPADLTSVFGDAVPPPSGSGGAGDDDRKDPELTPEQSSALANVREKYQLQITAIQIQRYLGVHRELPATDKLALVGKLVENWQRSLATRIGVERNAGALPGDDYVLLACHLLRDVTAARFAEGGAELNPVSVISLVFESLVLLSAGLKESKHNFQFRLMQLYLYNWIGPVMLATDAYNGLRPKHMQIDTLTFLVLPMLERCGGHFVAKQLAEDCYIFHRNSDRDLGDGARQAYMRSSFSKILEFAQFGARLRRSLQFTQFKAFAAQSLLPFRQFSELQLFLRKVVTGEIPVVAIDMSDGELAGLEDLSDFDAAFSFDPPATDAGKAGHANNAVCDIRIRQLYVRLLYWVVENKADSIRDALPMFTTLLQNAGALPPATVTTDAIASGITPVSLLPWEYYQGLLKTRSTVEQDIWAQTVATFGACRVFFNATTTSTPATWEQVTTAFTSLTSSIATLAATITESAFVGTSATTASTVKSNLDVLVHPGFLAECSLFVSQLLSAVVVAVFTCCKAMPKRKASGKKAGKAGGKSSAPADPLDAAIDAAFASLKDLVSLVSKGLAPLVGVLASGEKFKPSINTGLSPAALSIYTPDSASSEFAKSPLGVSTATAVYTSLQQSYAQSFAQLHSMITERISMAKAAKI